MKFCPHCGATLADGAFSFCPECGKALETSTAQEEADLTSKQASKSKRGYRGRKKVKQESASPAESADANDGYDGYYEDIRPLDSDQGRDRLDRELLKKVFVILGAVVMVIGVCVAFLCLL